MWGCFRSFEYEKLRNCCFLYQLLFPHCEQWKYPGWLYDVGDFTAQIILGLYEQCSKPDCLRHIEDYTTHVRIIINHYIKGSLLNNRYFMERSESFFDLIMGWMYGIYCIYIYIFTSWCKIYAFLWRDPREPSLSPATCLGRTQLTFSWFWSQIHVNIPVP